MRFLLCLLLLAPAGVPIAAAADLASCEAVLRAADPAMAGPRTPARLEAMAAVHRATLEVGDPARANPELRRKWFADLRERLARATDPEVRYFLETQLRLDPAGPSFEMLAGDTVAKVPYQPGQGVEADLADTARSLDLAERPRLGAAQLRAIALDPAKPADVSGRALVLLRRLDANAAAPLLWDRLRGARKRSDVLYWEEQIMRLPVGSVGAVGYDDKASPAVKAAWLRLAAVRPVMPVGQPGRAGWIDLLKGPANEVTEAAWDAAPRVFRAADRAELAALAKDAPERVAARAKLALERLR